MIDFTEIIAINIPEGNVIKIAHGDEILWEKPIVVFPLTSVSASIGGAWSKVSGTLTFTRPVAAGENYIIYFNGTALTATATGGGTDYTYLYDDSNNVQFTSTSIGENQVFTCKLSGWVTSATLEVHYIP